MMYQWDDDKNRLNKAAHGVAFEAAERFEWSTAMVEIDSREDYGELREKATGFIGDVPYALIFTHRSGLIRIISLRKATRLERKRYGQQNG
jgi:uncharacterized protein